jgi:drug/metabolite transporter (DMT)-like permease
MNVSSFAQLVTLGAIWGGAHALTRFSVPVFGPVMLVEARIVLAAILLSAVAIFTMRPLRLKTQWRQIVVLGAVNTAIPFFLLTYAAIQLNASVLSVLNATAPVFGAVIGALWLKDPLSARKVAGMLIGISGVSILLWSDLGNANIPSAIPVAAALGTACAYGFSSNYARRHAATLDHFNSAHGSLWVAALLIAPATPFFPIEAPISMGIAASVITLGVLCTGIAYLIYFKLIHDVGPASALTVAFLIPVFGVLWGVVFLNEPITPALILGGLLVIAGTVLTTGFRLATLRPRPTESQRSNRADRQGDITQ